MKRLLNDWKESLDQFFLVIITRVNLWLNKKEPNLGTFYDNASSIYVGRNFGTQKKGLSFFLVPKNTKLACRSIYTGLQSVSARNLTVQPFSSICHAYFNLLSIHLMLKQTLSINITISSYSIPLIHYTTYTNITNIAFLKICFLKRIVTRKYEGH